MAEAAGAYNGPWEKGIYGFIKPTNYDDFVMHTPFLQQDGLQSSVTSMVDDVEYPLHPPGSWLVLAAKVDLQSLSGASPTYAAGASYTTVTNAVEFRTTDTWYNQEVPQLNQADLELAMKLVAGMPQFHENPLHIAAIGAFLRAVGPSVLRVAKSLIAPAVTGTIREVAYQHPKAVRTAREAFNEALAPRRARSASREPAKPKRKPKPKKVRVVAEPAPQRKLKGGVEMYLNRK